MRCGVLIGEAPYSLTHLSRDAGFSSQGFQNNGTIQEVSQPMGTTSMSVNTGLSKSTMVSPSSGVLCSRIKE